MCDNNARGQHNLNKGGRAAVAEPLGFSSISDDKLIRLVTSLLQGNLAILYMGTLA